MLLYISVYHEFIKRELSGKFLKPAKIFRASTTITLNFEKINQFLLLDLYYVSKGLGDDFHSRGTASNF